LRERTHEATAPKALAAEFHRSAASGFLHKDGTAPADFHSALRDFKGDFIPMISNGCLDHCERGLEVSPDRHVPRAVEGG